MTVAGNNPGGDDDVFAYLYRPERGAAPVDQPTQQISRLDPGPDLSDRPQYGQSYDQGYGAPAPAGPYYGGPSQGGGPGGGPGGGGPRRISAGPIVVVLALVVAGVLGVWALRLGGDEKAGAQTTKPSATQPAQAKPSASPSATATAGPLAVTADGLELAGGAVLATDHKGYTGKGFVAGLEAEGSSAAWAVDVPKKGSYRLTVTYSNALGTDGQQIERKIGLSVNEKPFGQLRMPVIGSWDAWGDTWRNVKLKEGTNQIVIACGAGDSCHVNIDKLVLTRRS